MKKSVVYMFMIGLLLSGTGSALASKAMNEQSADGQKFHHPYFQAFSMFIAEAFCFLAYKVHLAVTKGNLKRSSLLRRQQTQADNYSRLGNFVFLIPAFFDLLSSTCSYIGLVLSAASVYAMFRGSLVVIVAIFSVIFLKKKLYRYQILGIILISIGITIVGVISVMFQASTAPNPLLGVFMLILAQIFNAIFFILEEKILSKIDINPLHAVGIEGISGIGYYLILLPIFYFIPCDLDICINGRVEDSVLAFKQIGSNPLIAFFWVLVMVFIGILNWNGIAITKYSSALSRSALNTTKTVLIWIASLSIGWEVFLWPQLIGFLLLVIGTLIYNGVLLPKLFGFKQSYLDHELDKKYNESVSKDAEDYTCKSDLSINMT